jgi:hypothetical protein
MEESKPKEYTQEQLYNMSYKDLVKAAIERGLAPAGMTKKQLKMMLGAGPKGSTVVDNAAGLSKEDIEARRIAQERVPHKTVYFDKDDDAFWKMKEKNPDAFDNLDMTDKSARSQHVFKRNVKCYCGEKFKIERVYIIVRDGVKEKRVDKKNPADVMPCPKCGRMYYYHNPDVESEIYAI